MVNWYLVEKNGKVIFEGFYNSCQRLVNNLKNSYRSRLFDDYKIIKTQYTNNLKRRG